MSRQTWTETEEEICCEVCVIIYVVSKSFVSIEDGIEKCKSYVELLSRNEGSIRMKCQNIKYLLDKWGVKNTMPISPLSNASKRNEEILMKILDKYAIQFKTIYKATT